MKITQIRNATLQLEFGGKTFLIDPMLAAKATYPGFPGTANEHLRNPLVELPLPMATILDVDAVIVTHTHLDHWDDAAREVIPKTMPIFSQNAQDADLIRRAGFTSVRVLGEQTEYDGITLIKTSGQHGSDEIYANPQMAERLGDVCGIIFQHTNEKSLYLAGDTVWNQHVIDALTHYTPDVVALNIGNAVIPGLGSIIMGKEDVRRVHQLVPNAAIVATHMEAVNHCLLSRAELRDYLHEEQLQSIAYVPNDGDSVEF
ncbi:MBL fold metallo-hydrolase [Pectobacterium colocasium]|uniref:MBL fold metallo-hydrolase n=1 Tax=Pectobacterium colocasium TaxID=2878098 RepID=UPI001CD3292F|nr:MBL fold metallo-hydrolase [Pectobacterium colocasium]